MEVGLRRFFGTIDARSHLNHIQIYLHDAFLRPESLNQKCEVCFYTFTNPRAFWPAEDVFCGLLGDGAAATTTMAAFALFHHRVEGNYVEAAMAEKLDILRSNSGTVHVGRNFLNRHPFLVDSVAFMNGFHTLESGDGRVYPTICNRQ